jgi:hypothetical protein
VALDLRSCCTAFHEVSFALKDCLGPFGVTCSHLQKLEKVVRVIATALCPSTGRDSGSAPLNDKYFVYRRNISSLRTHHWESVFTWQCDCNCAQGSDSIASAYNQCIQRVIRALFCQLQQPPCPCMAQAAPPLLGSHQSPSVSAF